MGKPPKATSDKLNHEHHETWIFDLDNTLYPSHCNLFKQMDQKMSSFIAELLGVDRKEARRIQKSYLHAHGTTLNGLMHEHNIDPHHFLDFVHDIDLSVIPPDPKLALALNELPGRKYIFTNGSESHVDSVIGQLGISDSFDGIFDIASADFVPKPNHETYVNFIKHFDVDPESAVMFEDIARNLVSPEKMGMSTVLVHSSGDWMGDHEHEDSVFHHATHDHIHHFADDLSDFLHEVLDIAPEVEDS